jgi:hypothetical protein
MRDRNGQEYFAPEVTSVMVAAYPAPIRNWISRARRSDAKPDLFARTEAHGLVSVDGGPSAAALIHVNERQWIP